MDNIYGFFLSLNFLSSAYNILLEKGPFRSLSLWSAVLNGMSHFSTLFCFLALVCPGHAEKIFFQTTYIYMCIKVVQCFNSNELKIVKNRLRGELHKLQRQT